MRPFCTVAAMPRPFRPCFWGNGASYREERAPPRALSEALVVLSSRFVFISIAAFLGLSALKIQQTSFKIVLK